MDKPCLWTRGAVGGWIAGGPLGGDTAGRPTSWDSRGPQPRWMRRRLPPGVTSAPPMMEAVLPRGALRGQRPVPELGQGGPNGGLQLGGARGVLLQIATDSRRQ